MRQSFAPIHITECSPYCVINGELTELQVNDCPMMSNVIPMVDGQNFTSPVPVVAQMQLPILLIKHQYQQQQQQQFQPHCIVKHNLGQILRLKPVTKTLTLDDQTKQLDKDDKSNTDLNSHDTTPVLQQEEGQLSNASLRRLSRKNQILNLTQLKQKLSTLRTQERLSTVQGSEQYQNGRRKQLKRTIKRLRNLINRADIKKNTLGESLMPAHEVKSLSMEESNLSVKQEIESKITLHPFCRFDSPMVGTCFEDINKQVL